MKTKKSDYCLVISTVPSMKVGRKIAEELLKKKLAACINILPNLESHYVWKGKRERTRELLLLIKTKSLYYPKLEGAITKLHPYEVPEILQIPLGKGNPAYLKWINQSFLN